MAKGCECAGWKIARTEGSRTIYKTGDSMALIAYDPLGVLNRNLRIQVISFCPFCGEKLEDGDGT